MSIQIVCINKEGGFHSDPHEAISRFGWVDNTGQSGYLTLAQMISFLERGGVAYVQDRYGRIAYLEVQISAFDHKYVRTRPDRVVSDNLLSLSECRV
jgi:hypothetical protein